MRALDFFSEARDLLVPESLEMGLLLRDEALALCRSGEYDQAFEMGTRALTTLVSASACALSLGRCWYGLALVCLNRREKNRALHCALRVEELWDKIDAPRHWRKEFTWLLVSLKPSFLVRLMK